MLLAKSAPPDFGILQLVTSNDHDVKTLFSAFKRWLFIFTYALLAGLRFTLAEDRFFNTPRL
jgi:hypothetical protein